MRRKVWIGLGLLLLVVVAVIGVRVYQDRPQPQRWVVTANAPGGPQDVPASATSFPITIDADQCNPDQSALDHLDIQESTDRVTVTAYVDPAGSPLAPELGVDDCGGILPGVVELSEPLGDRTLRVGGFESIDPTARESP